MPHEIILKVVNYYVDSRGREPFRDWLETLKDVKAQARIELRLDRLRTTGHFGDCKFVGEGVMELRIDCGPGYRIYYGVDQKQVVILLCGGDKSSQEKDIQRAKEYWRDYRRKNNADKT